MELAMTRSRAFAVALLLGGLPIHATAQSVTLDEGTFAVTLDGREAGTETFAIRRLEASGNAKVIANAVVRLDRGDGAIEVVPILEAFMPGGGASSYQIKVTGAESSELRLTNPEGRRFLAFIRTESGEEEREFLARPETHILETGVAHQYYFLNSVAAGSTTPIIEPRTRRQLQLTASAPSEETLQLGATSVPARKVTFSGGSDVRTVWFDRQGRVLRVEVPGAGYVAVRRDLVG
jgi:hypothetical protein